MDESIKPSQQLLNNLEQLDTVRKNLFELYKVATLDRNKEAVLAAQLDVMAAIGKIKKMLGIKEGGKK